MQKYHPTVHRILKLLDCVLITILKGTFLPYLYFLPSFFLILNTTKGFLNTDD